MKSFKAAKFILVVVLVAVAAGAIYLLRPASGPAEKDIRSIILISIDTCRADYLGCYGYPRRITPNIDKFAEESILFNNVISPVPITLPAHSSMLTGTTPPYHGVHYNYDYKLDKSNVTLAEILKDNGFTTGAVISSFILDSQFGLDQGFDYYHDRFVNTPNTNIDNERKGEEASRLAIQWLEKNKSKKSFLFLHYYDPHHNYEPPEPFATNFKDNLYAGEISYTDYCIGKVIKKLKSMSMYESSLIIITGDHGEMLGEHGEVTHMYFIYQSAVKVPLLLKLPGRSKPERTDETVGIIDIVPTICGALEIAAPSGLQGKDLLEKSRQDKNRYIYCESLYPTKYQANSLLGVVTEGLKYIQTTRPELYDLTNDPQESVNLVGKQPQRARILQDKLKQILEQNIRKRGPDSKLELSEEDKRRLESLGYVASSVAEDFSFDQSKEDPKDLIDFHQKNARAHQLILKNNTKTPKNFVSRCCWNGRKL
ncbi:sulfatase [Planctomycetota bacterium]